jgi:glycosyltransferase involved in cell wall biosynthesis
MTSLDRGAADQQGADVAPQAAPRSSLHIVLLDYRDLHHPEAGGAEVYVNEIFQRIAARGHRVTLLSARYRGAAAEERIGHIRVLRAGNTATANFAGARAALTLARRERVDVFVESICKLPFLLPVLTKIPVLPVVHHLFGHTIFHQLNPAVASYAWLYEKLIPPCYRGLRFVAVSESTAADLERRGVRQSRTDLVRNCVDFPRYQLNGTAPHPESPLLVYLGRLKRYKQIDITLRAFARVHQTISAARLVLVGKGDDQPRLEALARALGIAEVVTFAGYVSEEVKIQWLHRAHAVIYPSPKEGWGLAAIEAAACGTPVLASDSEGLRDAVRHGETGFLIPHSDVEAWARRMTEILTDAPLRTRMGAAAHEWARNFDWDVEAEKMRRIVEEVAAGPMIAKGSQ